MQLEPGFRTITTRLLLYNIEKILIKSNLTTHNYINRSHLDVINKLYYGVLSQIKVMILNKKIIKETGYELFEMEWNDFKSDFNNLVKQLIETPFVLVPFNLEDSIVDFPNFLKIQKSDSDIFRSYLMTFMIIHDLRIGIYKDGFYIKNKFPISLCENELIVGNTYYLKGNLYLNII